MAVTMAVLQLLLAVPTVVLHQRPLLCARRALRRAGPLAASVQTASGWRLAAGTASVQTLDLESTRDSTEGAALPGLTGADALTPAWMAHALARVHAHDYSCIARGQVFVAPSWLPGELLRALQSDVAALQERGVFFADNDRSVAGVHAQDWSSINGESSPCAARASLSKLFEALHLELEAVVPTSAVFGTQAGRKLFIDGPGATTKYSLATPGAPLGRHVDQYHEAFNKARGAYVDLHGERTRRSLAWLLYLGDEDWDRPGSRGSGGSLRAYPRADAVGRCGQHEGNLQVGWLERGCGSEAVFLDSWIAPPEMEGHRSVAELRRAWEREGRYASAEELGTALVEVQPSYGLYCLVDGVRVDLSAPHRRPCTGAGGAWLERARKWSGAQAPSLNEMLPEELRPSFSSMTATDPREQRRLVAVPPRGGTLVIFESNVVPHEVNPVLTGQRVYVGGFFAEERHVPPAWVDSAEAKGPRWACAAGWARTDDA